MNFSVYKKTLSHIDGLIMENYGLIARETKNTVFNVSMLK